MSDTSGSYNTATGVLALFSNTTGFFNSATGAYSLASNTDGNQNTAVGYAALYRNTADGNTATGFGALFSNTTGDNNTAIGFEALLSNATGFQNTANGDSALFSNTTGSLNTAIGESALNSNTTGDYNTAIGDRALLGNTTGNGNVALGLLAGAQQTTGSHNVYIGYNLQGTAGESNACYIASIFGQTSVDGMPVLINANHKLGTATSSKRFKEDIKPIDKVSEALFALKPVAFRYKKEIDPVSTPQLGLVAEDVEQVNPDLVVRDKDGKPYSVRYDQVNAMLLNEFLKEHHTILELKKEIAALTATVKEQATQIQKVSVQIETARRSPQVAVNNP